MHYGFGYTNLICHRQILGEKTQHHFNVFDLMVLCFGSDMDLFCSVGIF